jgi:hypothetical protein
MTAETKFALGVTLAIAGATISVADYVVSTGANPPETLGTFIANVDDLNGALAGLAPYVGVGTLLAVTGVILLVL